MNILLRYREALKKIENRLRFGSKLGLERFKVFMEMIGNPQNKLKYIHVAGTNGKGSTCAVISSILSEAGYKVGIYTSPSVIDFSERIKICSESIPEDKICELTEFLEPFAEEEIFKKDPITEFEFTTAMAFKYFYDEKCDVVVLETGLGGRLDATNIIENSICSVITSISTDHTAVLGNSLSEIAREKAGIIKKYCPVVLGPEMPFEAHQEILKKARDLSSPVIVADLSDIKNPIFSIDDGTSFEWKNFKLKTHLLGTHQLKNICTALTALECIKKRFSIDKEALLNGVLKAYMPCRLEKVETEPLIILDGAHNPDGAKSLSDFIKVNLKCKKLLAIVGMFKDKDYRSVIKQTAPLFSMIYTVEPNNDRALSLEKITEIVKFYNSNAKSFKSVSEALKNTFKTGKDYDGIIVYGSFSIMKEAKEFIESSKK